MTVDLRFGVLGNLYVERAGTPAPVPRSTVLRGLLGALLLGAGNAVDVEQLTGLVWADRAERTSRKSVHVGISRLRNWLGALAGPGDGVAIEYHAGAYLLTVAPELIDLGRFRGLVDEASTVSDPAGRGRRLLRALDLRRGQVLEGLTRLDRTDTLIRSVEADIRKAVLSLAETALSSGDPAMAIPAVRDLAVEHPFDEPVHARLIRLLAADGQQAAALDGYRELRERLVEELGVEPSALVKRVHLTVLSGQSASMGDARSPGEEEKEESIPEAPPAPAQLPADIPDFTGRETETGLVAAALGRDAVSDRAPAVRVVVITGLGGIGKTALAVHAAHRFAGSFSGGQLYANLKGASDSPADPADVLSGFLRALGVSGAAIPEPLEERAAMYRSCLAGHRLLIVLDNAATEEQIRPLIPGDPGSAVVVTSRAPLTGLEGAAPVPLDVLGTEQAHELLGRIVGAARVAAEPRAAGEILRLCDYIPLALRIAGARLRGRPGWSLAHLVELLADRRGRLDELRAGDLAVRVGFELTYARLPADARQALRHLGLLEAPDFPAWVVAALLDVPAAHADRQIETLIDAHLLTVVRAGERAALRYRMHDLVRLYAWERGQAEDSAHERLAAVERALGAWLGLLEEAAERVPGPVYALMHGTAERRRLPPAARAELLDDPMGWLDAERTALFAAVSQSCALNLDELAWDLAASMERYLDVRSLTGEWRAMHERAIEVCRAASNRRGEAVLLRGWVEVTTWTSSDRPGLTMTAVRERALEVQRMFAELGEPAGVADALLLEAWGRIAQGDATGALAAAEQALALATRAEYLGGQARAQHVLAIAHGEAEIDKAIVCLHRALRLAEEIGNPRFHATALQFLGAAYDRAGSPDQGRELLSRSLGIAQELQDRYLETFSVLYLGKLLAKGEDPGAMALAERSLFLGRTLCLPHHLADSLTLKGELHLREGQMDQAIACLDEAVDQWREQGWHTFRAEALVSLGHAHARSGNTGGARAAWHEACALLRELDDVPAAQRAQRLIDVLDGASAPALAAARPT
ncbi:AfsR/SARP family transcriptional regulator [Spirillospora sp. CA-294931]|uniref:AfsR/SARP family transcriptional regulator n=1 Tax=Spirillospora sp. CA-294931 TaxID=3240042 RepID=UPI003D8CD224